LYQRPETQLEEDPCMDMNKLLQWMDLAKQYQSNDFWNGIFEQSSFEEFMKSKSNMNQNESSKGKSEPSISKNFPLTDIYMKEDEILVISDLPGYAREDIQLSISSNKLLIRGRKKGMVTGKILQHERHHGDFERVIELPEPTYSNHIRAKFSNGLLLISYKREFVNEEEISIE